MDRIHTIKMGSSRLEALRKKGLTFDSVYMDGKLEDIKTFLLEIGGEAVQLGIKGLVEKRHQFLEKGKLFLPDNFHHKKCDPQMFDGILYSGFTLDEDGFWRFQDAWAYNEKSETLADTCPLALAYFGMENYW